MEQAFDKIQYLFIIKVLSKLGREGNFFNLIKNVYKNPATILNGEKLKTSSLISGMRQKYCLSLLLFKTVLEVLANVIRQLKDTKCI